MHGLCEGEMARIEVNTRSAGLHPEGGSNCHCGYCSREMIMAAVVPADYFLFFANCPALAINSSRLSDGMLNCETLKGAPRGPETARENERVGSYHAHKTIIPT